MGLTNGRFGLCVVMVLLPSVLLSNGDSGFGGNSEARLRLESTEDRILSPFTGYTRDHWLEITEQLIAGILPYFDPEKGVSRLTGVPGETGHFEQLKVAEDPSETLERSMLLVAIYTAATGKDRVPGYDGSITRPYLNGIIRGTDPDSDGYWGLHPIHSPLGTNIAMSILLSPKFLWNPLTQRQRDNLLDYLADLVKTRAWDCNCWYFPMMAVPLLEKHGRPVNRVFLTRIFNRLLNWYRGDGWYIDGGNFTFDYYNWWGFQLYNHALLHFDPLWRDEFGSQIKQASGYFQEALPYFFGRDGGPIPWGRSVTYRFAVLSAIGYPLLSDSSLLPPGQARRIASGCLKYFWERGGMSENGLLEPGFHGPNSVVAEDYIRRGGPYWAVHGLVPLVLPQDHPFWTDKELPMPADRTGGRRALKGPEIVLKVSPLDGEARLYPGGSAVGHKGKWQRGIKYFQHAYSSYLGWPVLGEGSADLGVGRSGISFDGKTWQYRTNPTVISIAPERVESTYEINLPRPEPDLEEFGEVRTDTLIGDDGEIHVFWHTSARPAYLYLGGYGISIPHGDEPGVKRETNQIQIQGAGFWSIMQVIEGPPGRLAMKLLEPQAGWSHSHLFGGRGAFPFWQSEKPVLPYVPVVVFVNGSHDRPLLTSASQLRREGNLLYIQLENKRFQIELPR